MRENKIILDESGDNVLFLKRVWVVKCDKGEIEFASEAQAFDFWRQYRKPPYEVESLLVKTEDPS